jgi:hypothetical protein
METGVRLCDGLRPRFRCLDEGSTYGVCWASTMTFSPLCEGWGPQDEKNTEVRGRGADMTMGHTHARIMLSCDGVSYGREPALRP